LGDRSLAILARWHCREEIGAERVPVGAGEAPVKRPWSEAKMFKQTIASEPISLPFFVADAWVEKMSRSIAEEATTGLLAFRRHQLSTGSARIDVLIRKKTAGWFELFALSETQTILQTYVAIDQDNVRKIMAFMAERLREALVLVASRAIRADTTFASILADVRATLTAASETLPQEPREPERGDSVDAWLDWRETKRKRGERLTLEDIAEQSGWSLSTIKKQSAQRKVRGKGTKS
jgi:hypothetical protein